MEWFFVFVGLMVVVAVIRVWNRPNRSTGQPTSSNEPVHYWMGHEAGTSDGGWGISSDSSESGGDSFDGGSSDGGGGDSSGF